MIKKWSVKKLWKELLAQGRLEGSPVDGGAVRSETSEHDALRLIDEGNVIEDEGRIEEAMQRYEAAILLAPSLARAHLNRGNILSTMGKVDGALDAYGTAIKCNPDYAGAYYNLGNANARQGYHEAALDAYQNAIKLQPDYADAEVAQGGVLEGLGRDDEAMAHYKAALTLNPQHMGAAHNLERLLIKVGQRMLHAERYAELESYARSVLGQNQGSGHIWQVLGTSLQMQGKDGLYALQKALALLPKDAEIQINLGITLQVLGRPNEALASYRRALEIKPDFAEAHYNLGNTQKDIGQFGDAVVSYRRALEIKPDFAEAHNNLGIALQDLGQLDEAVASYRRALEIKPDFAEAHYNLGVVQLELGQLDEAVASCRRALEIKPDYAEAHSNLGISLLEMGRFDEGWQEYEYRWEGCRPKLPRPPSLLPQWIGQKPAPGARLLVFMEQGMGDMLQFARYLPLAAERFSGGVSILIGSPLLALFRLSFPMVEVLEILPADQRAWQWQCPLLSLPLAFGTTLEIIPKRIPYLIPDPARVAHWQTRIAALGLPASTRKIGVVWKTGAGMKIAQLKSITLQTIAPLLNQAGFAWFSLQKEPDPDKAPWVASGKLVDWADEFSDFNETASLAMHMDLIISVDTSVAHLAGGLGLAPWLFNRHASDWRWMRNREDSPWYPSMRIFTQKKAGGWDEVASRMATALREEFPTD